MGSFYSPKIDTEGLLFYLDASNKKSYTESSNTWNDLTKNKYTGTFAGTPEFERDPDSIAMSGSEDYITTNFQTSQNFQNNDPWTLIAGIRINEPGLLLGYGEIRGGVFNNQNFGGQNGGFGVSIVSQSFTVQLTDAITGTTFERMSRLDFSIGEWNYISYVYTPSTSVTSYKNGNFYSEALDSSFYWTTRSFDSRINYNTQGGWTNIFNMNISQLRIYNKAFSSDEIKNDYLNFKNKYDLP